MSEKAETYTVAEHYAAIGYVTSAWSTFEQVVQREIWRMAGIEGPIGACITSQIGSTARLLEALVAICHFRGIDKDAISAITEFVKPTGDLSRQRNRVVHDAWGFSDETGLPYRLEISAQHRLRMGAVETPTHALIRLAQKMLAHTGKFEKAMDDLKCKLATSPETPPQ
jgi:hypothetical protein